MWKQKVLNDLVRFHRGSFAISKGIFCPSVHAFITGPQIQSQHFAAHPVSLACKLLPHS